MKVKTDLDLCRNELKNAVAENLSEQPGNFKEGMFYYNTSTKSFHYYNGTGWVSLKPSEFFEFGKAAEGVLQIRSFVNGHSNPPQVINVELIDPADYDKAGSAAKAYGDAKLYTDTLFNNLIGLAPEELNTIYELAAAVQNNQNLLSSLQAIAEAGTKKTKVVSPALTPSNGICQWNCKHGLSLKSGDTSVICQVYEADTNEMVMCDTKIVSSTSVTFKIESSAAIAAGKYYAVFIG